MKFLKTLFPDLHGGFIEIRSIHPSGAVQSKFYPSVDTLIADQSDTDRLSKDHNVYFGVCPRSKEQGNKAAVRFVWSLWADLDAKDFKGGKEEILERLNSFPISPTIVVESGNGLHAYWRLKESIEIKAVEDIDKIEAYLKALAVALNGDPAAAELARILRLPETLNHKNSPLKEVVIVSINSEQQCNLGDFDLILSVLRQAKDQKVNQPGWIAEVLSNIKDGNRNSSFTKIIGRLNQDGWNPRDIYALLKPHALNVSYDDDLWDQIDRICNRYTKNNSFQLLVPNRDEMETEIKPFETMSLIDFLAKGDDKIEWIVEGILPYEGVAILAGPAGQGKSWMMLDLLVECAKGGKWLSEFATKKVKVLYIDEESSPTLLRRRLNKLLMGKGILKEALDINLIVGCGLCFTDSVSVSQIHKTIKSLSPDLVIVDSLIRVHRAEENSATEMAQVFSIVKNLVREFKCAFWFSDHQRKPGQHGGELGVLLRGSTEKAAFVDTLLSLQRKENILTVEHSKSRFAESLPSFVVKIEDPNPDSTIVSYEGEADIKVREERLKAASAFVKLTLINDGGYVARKVLVENAKLIKLSEKKVDAALKKTLEVGLIERRDDCDGSRGGKNAFYKWKAIENSVVPFLVQEIENETNSLKE